MHFFAKIFGHVRKKQYLCTRFRKGSKHTNGAVVQLVRIHACHAWGRGFESRPHRKKKQKCFFFCYTTILSPARGFLSRFQLERLLLRLSALTANSNLRVPSAPQEEAEMLLLFCRYGGSIKDSNSVVIVWLLYGYCMVREREYEIKR